MHIRLLCLVMPHHHVQHMQNMGPNLLVHNENIDHIMPRGTARVMMSCAHHVACSCRQAGHPMYTWRARNNLWTCHLHKLNDIYQKYLPHILAP